MGYTGKKAYRLGRDTVNEVQRPEGIVKKQVDKTWHIWYIRGAKKEDDG
jgi:hypothetical protein